MNAVALNRALPFVALIGGLILTCACAGASEADKESIAAADVKQLVGTWSNHFTFSDCSTGAPLRAAFPTLNTYFRDGSHTEISSGRSPALRTASHGQWRRVDGRTFVNRFEFFLFDAGGIYIERAVYERTIELSVDGNSLTAWNRYKRYTTDDVVAFTGCASEEGVRMPEPALP